MFGGCVLLDHGLLVQVVSSALGVNRRDTKYPHNTPAEHTRRPPSLKKKGTEKVECYYNVILRCSSDFVNSDEKVFI